MSDNKLNFTDPAMLMPAASVANPVRETPKGPEKPKVTAVPLKYVFKLPEDRERILIDGEEMDLLDLTRISDNIDWEMRNINRVSAIVHEILIGLEEDIGRMEAEKIDLIDSLDLRKAELTQEFGKRKETDKSWTVDRVKAEVSTHTDIKNKNDLLRNQEDAIRLYRGRAARLRGYIKILSGKADQLMTLGSAAARQLVSGDLRVLSPTKS